MAIEVVAHRGASDDEPEHSLAAYVAAIDQGADAIECDVRLTKDGVLVCVHDRRIDRTSSGRGVVSTLTLSELSRYDFSQHEGSERPATAPADASRTRVLTLETLLTTALAMSDDIRFAIETKHPVRYGHRVEEALAQMLLGFGLVADDPADSRARVMSFSRRAVLRSLRLLPTTPTTYLMDPIPWWHRNGSLPRGVQIAGPGVASLRRHPHYVDRVHDRGGRVHVWTVDDPADVDLCVRLGVDAIITNRPAAVLRQLGR